MVLGVDKGLTLEGSRGMRQLPWTGGVWQDVDVGDGAMSEDRGHVRGGTVEHIGAPL